MLIHGDCLSIEANSGVFKEPVGLLGADYLCRDYPSPAPCPYVSNIALRHSYARTTCANSTGKLASDFA
jgi:hypothetical protein